MQQFAKLFDQLERTNSTNRKVAHLAEFFRVASDEDKIWTLALFSHKRPRRTVTTTLLREWAAESSDIPLWLFEESYHIVGDLAETIALLTPSDPIGNERSLTAWIEDLIDLNQADEQEKKAYIVDAWSNMTYSQKFVFNKLITGGFRVGLSRKLMVRALASYTGQEENILMHKLMGNWDPQKISFDELIRTDDLRAEDSKPYPFYLAYQLEGAVEDLGAVDDWQAERKWDGIRAQVIKRGGEIYVWSRGEELVTDRYPELGLLTNAVPEGTVLDGELLAYKDAQILSFQHLQKRIGRKTVGKKLLKDIPVVLFAYDLLEYQGKDIREESLITRRKHLSEIVAHASHPSLHLSEAVGFKTWKDLAVVRSTSRQHHCEGLMLKHKQAAYQIGRKKGDWWKWKIEPLTIDAVMIYAMRGHGRRANLYTDYTFAVWDGDRLVPFTKAYSGLTDEEFGQVDRFVKQNTLDRFGPVRSVKPELVFEIAFEGIAASSRHKSGIALRFPRMKRWRKDKPAKEANTLQELKDLLKLYG